MMPHGRATPGAGKNKKRGGNCAHCAVAPSLSLSVTDGHGCMARAGGYLVFTPKKCGTRSGVSMSHSDGTVQPGAKMVL